MPGMACQRERTVRQNSVIDIFLIIVFSLSLLICGKASASSGWQSRDGFQKEEELGSPLVGSLTAAACHSLQSPGKHAISFFSVGYMAYSASYLGNPED